MLYTAEPVRDRGWWIRTAVYWLVLLTQDAGGWGGWVQPLVYLLAVVPAAVAVLFRDRFGWVVAAGTLLLTLTVAEVPIAVGMMVVASRTRRWPVIAGYALAGAAGLLTPWAKLVPSGISATGPDPAGYWRALSHLIVLIVLPALVGMVRRVNREANQQRLRFESEQRELAAQQAVTEERNRIAQEMHDVLGHKLSLITVQAGALEVNSEAGSEVVGRQAELIRATARQALDDLRGILGVLGESAGDSLHPQPGLTAALDLVEHNRASGMRIEVDNQLPDSLELPVSTGAAVHRVVQEGLTNVLRHAPGAASRLSLSRPSDHILRIELVNRPSAHRGAGPGSGRGLPGMGERVRSLGGRLDAGPTPEGGYRLTADLPLAPADEEDLDE